MWKSKTVYASLAACLTSFGAYMAQEITMPEMAQLWITSLLAIFLRHGISKTQVTADAAAKSAAKMEASAAEIVAMQKPAEKITG